ncbi:hypothetical protein HS1genome_1381 [Sulfodiicoccus acidiphilus]|uniref:HEPN domain-containing protein n=1 Tax=Sulfodiicoccus acidiphilus TaxID=1670455 RepID=A0A348B490_9CREN|nr:HEPN domain-containing protein [Sulfodiicoccus acidiphilus]BBD72992.1 hypothetical protein HS1genome_1381 [Sulfodiicoccus acidiphilus]GGT87505.1 hypothetical protein GCM10007116_01760 [Sulfodiicoccus acidiphilus]
MNNSALASEYMLRASRSLKEARQSHEEGDLVGAVVSAGEAVDYAARVVLALYGIVPLCLGASFVLEYLISKGKATEIVKLVGEMEEIALKGLLAEKLDESSLKSPSVVVREVEVKATIERASRVIEAVEGIFDDFHD